MATKIAPARKSVRKKRATSSAATKSPGKKSEAKKDLSKNYKEYKDFEDELGRLL